MLWYYVSSLYPYATVHSSTIMGLNSFQHSTDLLYAILTMEEWLEKHDTVISSSDKEIIEEMLDRLNLKRKLIWGFQRYGYDK